MRLNVSQPDCIVCNGSGGEPEDSIQKETEAVDDTSEPWMQPHVERRAANKCSSDEENTPEPRVRCQVPHPKAWPKLPGTNKDHRNCTRDVRPDQDAFGPESFETVRCVENEVVQRISAHVIGDGTQN